MTSAILPALPTSVRNADEALRRHGSVAAAYLHGMWRGDPLADACAAYAVEHGRGRFARDLRRAVREGLESVPQASGPLRALVEQVQDVPPWADLDAIDLGVKHLARYSRPSGIVLGAASLLAGYANPTASRPLQLTGRYIENAGMRTVEVASWLREASSVGGLRHGSLGLERTVRVRMIHAMVRHHLRSSPDWDLPAWGMPISQAHLAYTLDEFCLVQLRGLRQVGVRFLPHEVADGFYARWRYLGHLLGVEPDLLPASEHDQLVLEDLHHLTRPPMEDFCRELVRGINTEFLVPELEGLLPGRLRSHAPSAVHALERLFLGDEVCDDLHVPRSRLTRVVRATGPVLGVVNRGLDRSERVRRLRTRLGARYADRQEARLRRTYAVHHDLVDMSPDSGVPHPARVPESDASST